MTDPAPNEWQRLRYKSEDEWRDAVITRAREIWDAREEKMWGDDPKWKNYRQSWDQGTALSRSRCIVQAEKELGQ